MEPMEKKQPIINLLVATKLVFYTVLEFLDSTDLSHLYISFKGSSNTNHASLVAILQSYLYIRLNMISTDRSYYFFVYENKRFRNIQKLTIAFLVQSNNKFNQLFQLREERNIFFTNILAQSNCQQVINQLEQFSSDPQIPAMKLVRETVGIGCTSTFQNYLVSLKQDGISMANEEYPNLSEFYQKRSNQSYIKQFFKIGHSKGNHPDYQKIKRLRLAAYLINCQQKKNYELSHNEMHNFLVGLFAMADQMVQATAAYLNGIQDPFYRLMEFCLRYAIYRNFVLSIQEKFEFVFETYQSIYEQTFEGESVQISKFSFWRPALSKWIIKMSEFHNQCTKTFNLIILRKRYQNINNILENLCEEEKLSDYLVVRNWVNVLNIQQVCGNEKPLNKQIFEIIQQQLDFCLAEYSDYQMDMSINQVSVHWCGFTEQKLGYPFSQFQEQVLGINEAFYQQLMKIQWNPETLMNIFEKDLTFLQQNNLLKCKIFSQVIESAKQKISIISNKKLSLVYQHKNLDERIKNYNQKNKIPEQIGNPEMLKFYSIVPMGKQQICKYIEKKSIDTIDQSDCSFDNEQYEYHSEDIGQLQDNSKIDKIQSFMEDESNTPLCADSENQHHYINKSHMQIL